MWLDNISNGNQKGILEGSIIPCANVYGQTNAYGQILLKAKMTDFSMLQIYISPMSFGKAAICCGCGG